ncbi:MAG: aldo/keto reductase [Schleiferilactobacillus harbinensis]
MNKAKYVLRDGLALPQVGFGTSGLRGTQGARVIEAALSNGYRLIDTAYNYENEGTVGMAIRRSSIPREQILVSSKLPGRYHAYPQALQAIQESLYRSGLDYFDLYLIHWPNPTQGLYVDAWRALIDAQKFGLVRSIGVSNFLPVHLDCLAQETGVLPVVNQVELHPTFSQASQRQYDAVHNILTEVWSPLGGHGHKILQLPLVSQLAEKYHKTPAQIILRWEIELGVLPLPLSGNSERQVQNLAVFDFTLASADMQALTALDRPDGRVTGQNPQTHEEM